jgi:MoaA/NifB/PqqE/SkfB family radical SAM enzyme
MSINTITKHVKPLINLVRKKPVLAIFEINLQCNSRCGYCDLPLNEGRYEMSRIEIKNIFASLYDDGLRYVFIQGGEPTLRKDLIEVMRDLHSIGLKLSLITNGTRLTEKFVSSLKQLPVDISVSLDSLDRGRYKEIRGADQLNLVLSGLQQLQDYPHPKYITCIVSDKNRHDVIDVVKYAGKHGFIPVVGAYHWDIERYGKVDAALQYENSQAKEVFEELVNSDLIPKGYFRNYLKDNIQWLSGNGLKKCDAGTYSIAIDSSGNVAPCLALKHAGNLKELSLHDILSRFDRGKIEQCSNNSSCNMMCSRIVGSNLRDPLSAVITPDKISAQLT